MNYVLNLGAAKVSRYVRALLIDCIGSNNEKGELA